MPFHEKDFKICIDWCIFESDLIKNSKVTEAKIKPLNEFGHVLSDLRCPSCCCLALMVLLTQKPEMPLPCLVASC